MHLDIRHGQHALPDPVGKEGAVQRLKTADLAVEIEGPPHPPTPFGYMFASVVDDPANRLPQHDPASVIAGLKALGAAMVEEQPPADSGNSTVPAIYTYWGQFIDHDLTLTADLDPAVADITNPAFVPLPPQDVVANLQNLREPTLELDSVYDGAPVDGPKLKVGCAATGSNIPGEVPPPAGDLDRDLPRGPDKKALIGDPRNDENLIVAQFHVAFLRFHNAAVDWIKNQGSGGAGADHFQQARDITRWHYQWLVVHDYLETLTRAGTVHRVLLDGPKNYQPDGAPYMPLEFSAAAFRFGHSMVRAGYDHNRNFGRGAIVAPFATLDQLFQFTGMHANPFLGFADTLPFNWIIEWDRFVDKGSAFANRFTRKIDTRIAPPLAEMLNEGNNPSLGAAIRALLKHLAQRNLLRGYLMSLPTGQAVAQAMGVPPLTETEIQQGNSDALNQILVDNGFVTRMPLWYYLLKEAEVHGNGNTLGEVGSRLIAETIIGLVVHDPHSWLNQAGGWTPAKGVRLANGDPIVTIRDFLRFAGLPA